MESIAATNCTVLLEGESGTGKELFAHAIHSASHRKNGPFIAVNCASLPHSLVESELFGYEKGAFTGALGQGNPGKFELADGGTIFLDDFLWKSKANFCAFWTLTESFGLEEKRKRI